MAQPITFKRKKNFAENDPLQIDLNSINDEFDSVGVSLNRTINNLASIQSDDGQLRAGVVGVDQISEEAREMLRGLRGEKGEPGAPGEKGDPGKEGERGDVGASFNADAKGVNSERSLYDSMPKGFSFLAMDTGLLHWKLSDNVGDWSNGVTFGRGERGEKGEKGEKGDPGKDGVPGLRGIPGEPGKQGEPGVPGIVSSVDSSFKSVNLVGKRSLAIRLVESNGRLSLEIKAEV